MMMMVNETNTHTHRHRQRHTIFYCIVMDQREQKTTIQTKMKQLLKSNGYKHFAISRA